MTPQITIMTKALAPSFRKISCAQLDSRRDWQTGSPEYVDVSRRR